MTKYESNAIEVIHGRPAERRKEIVQELRRQIVVGQLAPGGQLPPRVEVEQHFKAGPVTVQRALDQLKREGFIETRGRHGTFVVANPPHLTHYPLVFHAAPNEIGWGRYWATLANEATALERATGLRLPIYYGVNGHEDSEDYQRLVREVKAHRVAGLIFASNPYLLAGTPLLSQADMPRVAIMSPEPASKIPIVTHDPDSFFTKAIEYLALRQRRRVAILALPQTAQELDSVIQQMRSHGMETRPYWIQGVHVAAPEAARNCAHLLMHEGQRERPDALIITDDNLVEYATAGLIAAGVRVPDDLEVVAHCNFPWPTPSVVPVQRLGYEVPRILEACLHSIDLQRSGKKAPRVTSIPAVYEEEVAPRFASESPIL